MLSFLKKKLHKRIILGIAIPFSEDRFRKDYLQRTDFILSLTRLYETDCLEDLWEQYRPTAASIQEKLVQIQELCVTTSFR